MRAGRKRKAGSREPSGRVQRVAEDLRALDVQSNTLAARCRAMGISPTASNLRRMRSQMAGCNAGRAIIAHVADPDEQSSLFAAVQHMRRVVAQHDAAIGAPRRHAVCLRLLVPIEAMTADADSPAPDMRSEAERSRAATSAMMRVEGWLGWTDAGAASEARRVCLEDDPVRSPLALLAALRCVADGLAGRRMIYRKAA